MTANERYEKAWNSYLVLLNRDSKIRLTPFLREQQVNIRGIQYVRLFLAHIISYLLFTGKGNTFF